MLWSRLTGDGRIPSGILVASMTDVQLSFRGEWGDARSVHFTLFKRRPDHRRPPLAKSGDNPPGEQQLDRRHRYANDGQRTNETGELPQQQQRERYNSGPGGFVVLATVAAAPIAFATELAVGAPVRPGG